MKCLKKLRRDTKPNLKWVKDFQQIPETIKLEENIGGKLFDISLGDDFLDLTPKAKMNKWGYISLKLFSTAKKANNRM